MPDPNEPPAGDADREPPGITRSEHARLRSGQGRPVAQVAQDIQRAGPRDVFVQVADGRFVVRGPKSREHVLETDGEHVTSLRRPETAHQARLHGGTIRAATGDELQMLKAFVH